MMMRNTLSTITVNLFLLSLFLLSSCSRNLTTQRLLLTENWEFEHDSVWYSAIVPGTIHTDLLARNLIPDPFYRDNEDSVQWVAEREWHYKTHFSKSEISHYKHAELVFEGLDCIAILYLNGEPLLHTEGSNRTDNMFRKWVFPLDSKSLKRDNELLITFLPTTVNEKEMAKQWLYQLPENRAFSRKAHYQSGWDWGPKLITCGIWKPVYIELWNEYRIKDCQIYQKKLFDEKAIIEVETCLEVSEPAELTISYFVNGEKMADDIQNQLKKGENYVTKKIEIPNPQKWYPNNMGEQPLYDISVHVKSKRFSDTINRTIGLRTIELVREKDSIGESFYFRVNGEPFFAKGANWIPAHSFPTEVTQGKYHYLLRSCKESNMNMIRVWGGGIYEDDLFYQYCDEMGILVW